MIVFALQCDGTSSPKPVIEENKVSLEMNNKFSSFTLVITCLQFLCLFCFFTCYKVNNLIYSSGFNAGHHKGMKLGDFPTKT